MSCWKVEGCVMNFIVPGIALIENVIPEISSLIEDLEYSVTTGILNWTVAEVAAGEGIAQKNTNVRDTSSIGIPMPRETTPVPDEFAAPRTLLDYGIGTVFKEGFTPHINQYLGSFGIEMKDYDDYQILKYGIGQKFDRHIDDHWRYHRRVSLVYYANDAYEGGEIEFEQFDLKIKPEKGNLLLFPSTYTYSHRVHPVTSGTRYSVVQWMR
jgi:hypothetical protein